MFTLLELSIFFTNYAIFLNGLRDMAPPSKGNLGAKFSETSFPHFTDLLYANRPLLSLDTNLKCLIPIILLCHLCSLSKMHMAHKKKTCVYFSTFPYIFIYFLCENPIRSQLSFFQFLKFW